MSPSAGNNYDYTDPRDISARTKHQSSQSAVFKSKSPRFMPDAHPEGPGLTFYPENQTTISTQADDYFLAVPYSLVVGGAPLMHACQKDHYQCAEPLRSLICITQRPPPPPPGPPPRTA
eukprot:NODE_3428_length_1222_cov_56.137398_g3254_i0.p1 GENE.NODE_3428_length_1222_cov_56.137398_g3254_i0~~NODE_3428_length_1222_cov_56.137398_g3254_i0.p1  ORF type:complete len:119 (-),score=2.42 NODE_3428_length_1222_cov_56.137398_g3254_i0:517-873(-)